MGVLTQPYLYRSLRSAGLREDLIPPIVSQVLSWQQHRGPEWMIARLKTLKAIYLQFVAGNPQSSASTGIKLHRDGTPKGVFRCLFKLKGSQMSVALNTLNCYTGVILPDVTKKQWDKFYSSVMKPAPVKSSFVFKTTREDRYNWTTSWKEAKYESISFWTSSQKRAPALEPGSYRLKSVKECELTTREHLRVLNDDPYHLDIRAHCNTILKKSCMVKSDHLLDRVNHTMCAPSIVGMVGFIQERGGKLRAIANPLRVHQAMLSRLGSACFEFLRTSCPWDCTFDQTKGVHRTVKALQEGRKVHSVDLTDATNNFPLDTQLQLITDLSRKVLAEDAELRESLWLFKQLSLAKWKLPSTKPLVTKTRSTITWRKGQPLGLYPSFPMFAIAHGFILKTIEQDLGLVGSFSVLGDDVVIYDDNVFSKYIETLDNLGCPISTTKSISSSTIAEFAGRIITSKGPLKVEKWKHFSMKSPLSPLEQWGYEGRVLIPRKFRETLLTYAALPEPRGLGLNPLGTPLGVRMRGFEDLYWESPEPVDVPDRQLREKQLNLERLLAPHLHQVNPWWDVEVDSSVDSIREYTNDKALIEHFNAFAKSIRTYEVTPFFKSLSNLVIPYVRRLEIKRLDVWGEKNQPLMMRVISSIVQAARKMGS